MFSKSTDGGDTWTPQQRMATVKMPHYWQLPNTQRNERVYNYPRDCCRQQQRPVRWQPLYFMFPPRFQNGGRRKQKEEDSNMRLFRRTKVILLPG